jgi:hypothetical protein
MNIMASMRRTMRRAIIRMLIVKDSKGAGNRRERRAAKKQKK